MAYTYEQFLEAANKAGLANRFTQQELAAAQKSPEFGISLMGLIQDERKATTEEQRLLATEAANQMRKSYGVMNTSAETSPGVADANQDRYAGLLDQANAQSSFAGTTPAVDTQDRYAGVLDQANAQSSFTYNPEQDPTWSAYKKQYAREGERASANTLAQAAAMSGGRPSSYALTAAQQQGNYYAGQMSDIIPELEQNAYQRYLYEQQLKQQEFDNALNLYQALGYATPEIEQILGIGGNGNGGSGGAGGSRVPVTEGDLYGDMMRDLEEEPGDDEYTVTNRSEDEGVWVGGRRMTWAELYSAVTQGRIIEVVDPESGTITYKYATGGKKEDSADDKTPAKPGGGTGGKKDFSMIAAG